MQRLRDSRLVGLFVLILNPFGVTFACFRVMLGSQLYGGLISLTSGTARSPVA